LVQKHPSPRDRQRHRRPLGLLQEQVKGISPLQLDESTAR
jgi:hypothetical protein